MNDPFTEAIELLKTLLTQKKALIDNSNYNNSCINNDEKILNKINEWINSYNNKESFEKISNLLESIFEQLNKKKQSSPPHTHFQSK